MTTDLDPLSTVKRYFKAIEQRDNATLEDILAPDFAQHEYPNRFMPNGAHRDLAGVREARERGSRVVTAERFDILHTVVSGPHIALEVQWTGTLAAPLGSLPAGGEMRARFGVFIEVRDGRLISQRNYDCFDPF